MARARRRAAKKATKKKAKRRPSRPRAPQSVLAGRPRVYWSPRGGQGKKKNPGGIAEQEQGDYSIIAAEDSHGWHWWASDETGRTMAAASTKPEKDEVSAFRSAKRAIKKYEARVYPARGAKPAKKAAGGGKRTRLPSILTRI